MAMLAAACGGGDDGTNATADPPSTTTEATVAAAPTTQSTAAPSTTSAPTTAAPTTAAPTTTLAPTLTVDGATYSVIWDQVSDFYKAPAAGAADPFFHIHSSNAADGFYLSFEMYTVWGQAWSGETGTFKISCSNPSTSTGICVHFIPVSAEGNDLAADFGATGTVVIRQLDENGYDIDVMGLTFTDGSTIADFTMTG